MASLWQWRRRRGLSPPLGGSGRRGFSSGVPRGDFAPPFLFLLSSCSWWELDSSLVWVLVRVFRGEPAPWSGRDVSLRITFFQEARGLQCGAYIRTSHPTRAVRRSSSLCWGQLLALKRATSSTPTDPQIEVSGTYATVTLPLGPLWVSDVPGLVLGPSFGLLGSQIKLRCLF